MVIDTLQLDIIVNNKGATARINSTTKALQNLYKTLNEINKSGGLEDVLNQATSGGSVQTKTSTKSNSTGGTANLGKTLKIGALLSKIYFIKNYTKRLGQDIAKVVQYGIDYGETLNLWQTAMKGNVQKAREFTRAMNQAYGISSATLMNYQATFKNMLSAIGSISEDTAYTLSETLTQMALDFSSLYNVSVESAMTKFQAALSGQIRPLRSMGIDISENTLAEYYKEIDKSGEKSLRQLSQSEKQLLRIYAIYRQLENNSALGDLSKTLTTSANQFRMMSEQSKEFATWIGVSFDTLLQKSGILVEINAALYVAVELARSLAYSLGYVEPTFGTKFSEDVNEANEAVDKLQGKLAGFDKFNVLQGGSVSSQSSAAGSVEKALEDAIEKIQSIYKGVDNPAVAKATSLLEALGGELREIKDDAGNVIAKVWEFPPALKEAAKLLGSFIAACGILLALSIEKKLVAVAKSVLGVSNSFQALMATGGLALVIYGVTTLITKWDELDAVEKLIAFTTIAAGAAFIFISKASNGTLTSISKLIKKFDQVNLAAAGASIGVGLFLTNLISLVSSWDKMSPAERIIGIFGLIGAAALVAASGVAAFHASWTMGTAAIAIVGGLLAIMGTMAAYSAQMRSYETHAIGGTATKGSLFIAGEAGPELVTRTSGGNSTIMNMQQLEDAVARGMIRGLAATNSDNDQSVTVNVDGQNLFHILRGVARRNGYDLAKVN